jgi:hypothetical protein
MPYVETERETIQRRLFGCLSKDIERAVLESLSGNRLEVAVSMLSNAQEQIERGLTERARQAINRAKYLINQDQQQRERITDEGGR